MNGNDTLEIQNILSTEHRTASEISTLWEEWKSYRQLAEQRWTEVKKYVFATSTRETTNYSNPWSNTTHRPKLWHIYNNLVINTDAYNFPNRDWLDFIGFDHQSASANKRRIAKSYMTTKHRISGFDEVMKQLEEDWILYGNCFSGVDYVTEYTQDPVTGEQLVSYTGPRPFRISPYDIVFNARSSSFLNSPKIVRSLKTMGELKKDIEENPSLGYSAEVVSTIEKERESLREYTETQINKAISFAADGYGEAGQYYKSGQVELLEFFGDIYDSESGEWLKNHVITIVDRRYILRKKNLNTYSGKPNIFQGVWRKRPDNLWGLGPLDNLVGLQYRINHLENARADAFDQMVEPDKIFTGDVLAQQDGASVTYLVPENGGVAYLHPDTTILNADLQISQLEAAMELYAMSPREALGIRSPGEKTKFEVQTLTNAANRAFEHQANLFASFVEQVVNAELEEARKHLNMSDIIAVVDDDYGAESFVQITREDITNNGKLIAVGAKESARKARLTQQLSQFQQIAMADPMVLQHFPARKVAEMYADLLDFEDLLVPYGRIAEEVETARYRQEAASMLQEEAQIDVEGLNTNVPATGPNQSQ